MRQCHKETNAERDKKSDENAVGKASKNDITDEVKQENIGTERDICHLWDHHWMLQTL